MAKERGAGGTVTSLADQAMRLVRAPRDLFTGWFGPGTPLTALAPREEVIGRQFDYPFASNVQYRPRSESSETGVSFAQLRMIAEPGQGGLDLLRVAIESRKDEMSGQRWTLQSRTKDETETTRAKAIEDLLRRPDGYNSFTQWLRMLLEEHLVLDAVAIYPRLLNGRPVLDLLDGTTIKILIDERGRRPLPPLPAFQQYLHGMPAVDYKLDELAYYAYNIRTQRLYGLSRVEQVINTVTLGLRRALHVSEYYTAGSMPDSLIQVPETWNPDQIKAFQSYWDAILEGNTAERRKTRFIPGGTDPKFTKDAILKDEFDEWLARIICYCFSLSPQALVKAMNRATAETDQERAQQQGIEPLKLFVKGVIDDLLLRVFEAGDLELTWADEEITDPETKAKVTAVLVGAKPIIDVNEGRAMWGLKPKTPAELEAMAPTPPALAPGAPNAPGQNGNAKDPPEPAVKVGSARRGSLHPDWPTSRKAGV